MVEMPPRIARLPRDSRGYPIPWNVQIGTDGKPIFTVNDMEKHLKAISFNLCPICGESLGRWKWFTGGILSAYDPNGAYYDLPGHHECEQFALQTCPYLALPQYLGRIDVPDISKIPADRTTRNVTMIPERPELFVAVASNSYSLAEHDGTPVLRPQRPYLLQEFWKTGRKLELDEATPFLLAKMGADWQLPALRL